MSRKLSIRIIVPLWIAVVVLCSLFTVGQAQARLVQEKTLTAKPKAQTWESTSKGTAVYVTVYGRGGEIEQHWVSGCRANYPDRLTGLYVWVRIKECGTPGQHPYVVRYLSTTGPQKFRVRLTESASR